MRVGITGGDHCRGRNAAKPRILALSSFADRPVNTARHPAESVGCRIERQFLQPSAWVGLVLISTGGAM